MIATLIILSLLTRPSISLAIGQVESNMNYKAIGKDKEKGAFQVREKYWGKVSKNPRSQFIQHNKILNDLTHEHLEIELAVERYNGEGTQAKQYRDKVRQKALEIELLSW